MIIQIICILFRQTGGILYGHKLRVLLVIVVLQDSHMLLLMMSKYRVEIDVLINLM